MPKRRAFARCDAAVAIGGAVAAPKNTVSNVLMLMRKMANHPLLCRDFYD
jgi:hypothetical protein